MISVVIWVAILAVAAHSMRTLSASVTPQLLWLVGGLLTAYVVGKFFEYRAGRKVVGSSDAAVPADAPEDYKEYARIRTLLKKYESEEPFSWAKMLRGFVQQKNYGKAVVIGAILFVMVFVGNAAYKEIRSVVSPAPSIVNSGSGSVDSKNESKTAHKQNNGLTLNLFSGWF